LKLVEELVGWKSGGEEVEESDARRREMERKRKSK